VGIALLAILAGSVPARASHRITYRYLVANPSRGYGTVRNVPNVQSAVGFYSYGGATFSAVQMTQPPQWFQVTDDVFPSGGIGFSVCQPDCETIRFSGCTPDNGRVSLLNRGFVKEKNLLIFLYASDALTPCAGNAGTGTLTLKFQ